MTGGGELTGSIFLLIETLVVLNVLETIAPAFPFLRLVVVVDSMDAHSVSRRTTFGTRLISDLDRFSARCTFDPVGTGPTVANLISGTGIFRCELVSALFLTCCTIWRACSRRMLGVRTGDAGLPGVGAGDIADWDRDRGSVGNRSLADRANADLDRWPMPTFLTQEPNAGRGVMGDADRMSDGVDADEVRLMEQETASGERARTSDSRRPVTMPGVGEEQVTTGGRARGGQSKWAMGERESLGSVGGSDGTIAKMGDA